MSSPSPRPFLMGAETEYAVSGLPDGTAMDADVVYDLLAEAIDTLASRRDLTQEQAAALEGAAMIADRLDLPGHRWLLHATLAAPGGNPRADAERAQPRGRAVDPAHLVLHERDSEPVERRDAIAEVQFF